MRRYRQFLLLVAVPLLVTVTLGCTHSGGKVAKRAEKIASTRPSPLPPPLKANVDLDSLVAQHPLQGEVMRLNQAEQRLQRLGMTGVAVSPVGAGGASYPLRPLLAGAARVRFEEAAAISARRATARARVQREARTQLASYAASLQNVQDRVLDQRRAELEAAGKVRTSAAERIARQEADAELRRELESRVPTRANLIIKRDAVLNDIALLPPTLNLADELKKLESNPDAPGISDRARFEYRRDLILARIATLEAEFGNLRQAASSKAQQEIDAALKREADAITSELDALRRDVSRSLLVQRQRTALQTALAEEERDAAAVDAGLLDGVSDGGGGTLAGSLAVPAFAPGGATIDLADTLRRVRLQRDRLRGFIRADVAEAVRDAAFDHNVDVQFGPVVAGSGRKDMTTDFKAWMRKSGPSLQDSAPGGSGT